MKKYFLILSLALIFLSTAHSTSATSGACSSHGGVNCGIKNYDSGAICNDSFISSTLYSNTDECKVPPKQCDYPVQPYCSLSDINQQKQNALDQARLMDFKTPDMFPAHQAEIESTYSLKSSACQSQLTAYQSQISQYNLCLNSQTNTTNVVIIPAPPQNCGPNAFPTSDSSCSCQTGYKKFANQCVTIAEYCPSMDGPGAIPSSNGNGFGEIDNECTCAPGYTKTDYVFARCTPITQPKNTKTATTTAQTPLTQEQVRSARAEMGLDKSSVSTATPVKATTPTTNGVPDWYTQLRAPKAPTSIAISTTTQPQVKQSFMARMWGFIRGLF